ncbi:hypothetical protein F1559_004987 [Cyanidiococcus yangmingshanensis]|uniref:Uncharacterized protein n=1 Tax=Cyanidiococcus yangmingshanensis TaxID=2690220 RepID=A0A7J7ING2_9RHOD|nr:hypothetical protein F1559_004987 [Cyanidiococcus yangmingshanensis]
MARRGRGTTASARRQQLQQRGKESVAGSLRPLVPFYVPDGAAGAGKVNTDLRFYESQERNDTSRPLFEPSPGAAGAAAPIPVRVRNWDARQGTFGREAVHYVSSTEPDAQAVQCRSSGAATQSVSAKHMTLKQGSESTSNLLTPEMILQNGGNMNSIAGNTQYACAEEEIAGPAHTPNLRPRARNSLPAPAQIEKTTVARSSTSTIQSTTFDQHEAAHRRMTGPSRGLDTSPQHARRNPRHGTLTSKSSQGKRSIPADEHARYAGSSYSSTTPAPQAVPVPQFAARYLANQAAFLQESPGWVSNQFPYPNRVAEHNLSGADMRLPTTFGAQHPIREMNHTGQPLMPLSIEASNVMHMRAPDPIMPHADSRSGAARTPCWHLGADSIRSGALSKFGNKRS